MNLDVSDHMRHPTTPQACHPQRWFRVRSGFESTLVSNFPQHMPSKVKGGKMDVPRTVVLLARDCLFFFIYFLVFFRFIKAAIRPCLYVVITVRSK
jgi:hypothetical protein